MKINPKLYLYFSIAVVLSAVVLRIFEKPQLSISNNEKDYLFFTGYAHSNYYNVKRSKGQDQIHFRFEYHDYENKYREAYHFDVSLINDQSAVIRKLLRKKIINDSITIGVLKKRFYEVQSYAGSWKTHFSNHSIEVPWIEQNNKMVLTPEEYLQTQNGTGSHHESSSVLFLISVLLFAGYLHSRVK